MDPPEQPPLPPYPGQAHMFQSASNLAFYGGQFIASQTIYYEPNDEARLKIVYDTAAPNAILNAGGRADEVRCFPGTREEVLSKCEGWMDAHQQTNNPQSGIFWLSGPAGAGKSAIVQTLAERCIASGRPMANFFFFRNDSTRSNAVPLVTTLLIQLFSLYPDLKLLVAIVLAEIPLIFSQSLRDQVDYLIDMPIRFLREIFFIHRPVVLLIDGLDECSSAAKHEQQYLLTVLHELASRNDSPFRILVASRPEPHLTMTFNEVGCSSKSIFLDEQYRPEADIRLFVVAELARIKRTHHLRHTLPKNWPAKDHINMIVAKSSGQFIFAATVLRFIAGSAASPAFSLEKIQGLRPVIRASPFSELDAIYSYILCQVDDWKPAKDVFTAEIIRQYDKSVPCSLYPYLCPLGYEKHHIPSFVSEFTALVKLSDSGEELQFYHASFTDFLLDENRSGDYYIDVEEFCDTWAPDFVRCIRDNDSLIACRVVIEQASGPSLSTTEVLLSFPTLESRFTPQNRNAPVRFMGGALRKYCRNDDELYMELVQLWLAWFRKNGSVFKEGDINDLFFLMIPNL